MSEFRGLSRLPDDPGYWDSLEQRITDELGPRVRAGLPAVEPWWTPLAVRSWGLVGLAAAAGLAAVLLLPPRVTASAPPSGLLRGPESDPALQLFAAAEEPPAVSSLILPTVEGADGRR